MTERDTDAGIIDDAEVAGTDETASGGTDDRSCGTYTLVFSVPAPVTIEVGALGSQKFTAGGYAYTGSAFGSGGFVRIDRHRRVAAGDHDVRHWHVDYLAGHPSVDLVSVARTPGRDRECSIAKALLSEDTPVPGFGASDCACPSHLAVRDSVDAMVAAVRDEHR